MSSSNNRVLMSLSLFYGKSVIFVLLAIFIKIGTYVFCV